VTVVEWMFTGLLGDRVWPLVEDLPLTSVNLAAMDQLFGSTYALCLCAAGLGADWSAWPSCV
jgi:hypothetical protein